MFSVPDLPVARPDFPLVAIGSQVYLCAVFEGYDLTGSCHVLDTEKDDLKWEYFTTIPSTRFHLAEVIQDHIWFFSGDTLYDLDTNKKKFKNYTLPFSADTQSSSAGNGTHVFVFGAKPDDKYIWINRDASNPSKWKKAKHFKRGFRDSSTLWFGDKIYIAGGSTSPQRTTSAVYQFDVFNNSIEVTTRMNEERAKSRMMVLDNKPAVVGGFHTVLDSVNTETYRVTSRTIEYYDERTDSWVYSEQLLKNPRCTFALVQLTTEV